MKKVADPAAGAVLMTAALLYVFRDGIGFLPLASLCSGFLIGYSMEILALSKYPRHLKQVFFVITLILPLFSTPFLGIPLEMIAAYVFGFVIVGAFCDSCIAMVKERETSYTAEEED